MSPNEKEFRKRAIDADLKSLRAVSHAAQMGRGDLRAYLDGTRCPRRATIERIAEVIKTPVDVVAMLFPGALS